MNRKFSSIIKNPYNMMSDNINTLQLIRQKSNEHYRDLVDYLGSIKDINDVQLKNDPVKIIEENRLNKANTKKSVEKKKKKAEIIY